MFSTVLQYVYSLNICSPILISSTKMAILSRPPRYHHITSLHQLKINTSQFRVFFQAHFITCELCHTISMFENPDIHWCTIYYEIWERLPCLIFEGFGSFSRILALMIRDVSSCIYKSQSLLVVSQQAMFRELKSTATSAPQRYLVDLMFHLSHSKYLNVHGSLH